MELDIFLRNSGRRYPSSDRAVQKLRSLGEPPSVGDEFSSPSPTLQIALDIMGSFAYNSTAEAVGIQVRNRTIVTLKKHWGATIDQWVRFFLETIAVSDEEPESLHLYGLGFLARTSYAVAILLGYPDRCQDMKAEVQQLRLASPYILPLIMRVWLKVLHWSHVTWIAWTGRVFRLIVADSQDIGETFLAALERIHDSKQQNVPEICIRHLHQRTLRIGDMTDLEANTFRMFIKLIGIFFDRRRALYIPFLLSRGIRAHVKHLNSLIAHRKLLKRVKDDSKKFKLVFQSVYSVADHLTVWLNGPRWVSEALDAGVITLMFNGERFFNYDARDGEELNLATKYCLLLRQISLYFVYPPVLRRFLGWSKKVTELGLEEKSQFWPSTLQAAWKMSKGRASALSETYRAYEPSPAPSMICGYLECPRKSGNSGNQPPPEKYLCCSSCCTVMYCSRTCARGCWRTEHRMECPTLTRRWKGTPHPTTLDVAFFRMIIETYTAVHGREIMRTIRDFESSRSTSGGKPTDPIVTTLIFHDLDKPNPMGLSCLKVVDWSTMRRENPMSDSQIQIIVESLQSVGQAGLILLVAFFPGTAGRKEVSEIVPGALRVTQGEGGEVSIQTNFQRMHLRRT
uniref:MYND-type domain-containing protein n=1 Tax=Moniliophthora roreri TaxID=221103 RepID=A0A0W0FPJ6_MONRR